MLPDLLPRTRFNNLLDFNVTPDIFRPYDKSLSSVVESIEDTLGVKSWQDDNNHYTSIRLAGYPAESVNLTVKDNMLYLVADNHSQGERKISYRVSIPHGVDTDNISAELTNGLLVVTLPRAEWTRPRQIPIQNHQSSHNTQINTPESS